ncbi:MAG: hypothetical protein OEU26_02235 [Candidatus Tectomicrobia bacterium]|nr:hypothetical protein [Candidatus Tectomicrobia bacterium]
MKIGLVLSNDWELFGNGSGDYFEIQHHPLQQLLDVVEGHGAPLTVMAEIGQQWAHQRLGQHESWAHDIACAWESILQDSIRRGSDVQLHLHPQWLNATYENHQWQVDHGCLSVSALPEAEMAWVLQKGKADLEALLKPIAAHYECLAFRSGWYCMQPSQAVTRYLLKAGFRCDTSVVPGAHEAPLYDYRGAYSNCIPWFANPDDVRYKSDAPSGLLEIPIHSYESIDWPILHRFNWNRLADLLSFGVLVSKEDVTWSIARKEMERQRRLAAGGEHILHQVRKKSIPDKLKRYLSRLLIVQSTFRLDYDNLSPQTFVKCLQRVYEANRRNWPHDDVILPIMASGHVKRMLSCENINRILEKLHRQFKDDVLYWTLSDATQYCLKAMGTVFV